MGGAAKARAAQPLQMTQLNYSPLFNLANQITNYGQITQSFNEMK